MDPTLFGLQAIEVNGDVSFVTPCYLVVHPQGTLIWDVGQVPDAEIPDDGTEVVQQNILKANRRLAPQLAALGYAPKNITFIAMSHYYADHTANAETVAQVHPEKPTYKYEKCYGIAKAGMNDCFFAGNSCAGTAASDNLPGAWIYLPKGTCQRIVGASLEPPATSK